MAGKIFVNYRRGDDPGFAGRLFDQLETAFGADRLFMDVDNIAPGEDFWSVLTQQLSQCDVLLVIIGNSWLDARDKNGRRRLDNPHDFVRIEIEAGLKTGKRVVPVLVNSAEFPPTESLPDPLKPLARRNAFRLTHDRFRADVQGLIQSLKAALREEEALRQKAHQAPAVGGQRGNSQVSLPGRAARERKSERSPVGFLRHPDDRALPIRCCVWPYC